jgi:SAM-dependent methyltransferase
MSAERVLHVGCGTGRLLHRARNAGHTGRLCGLDPDPAMLDQARVRADIEWVLADAASAPWDGAFDLAVMASHAFQVFVEDDQLRESLAAIREALVDDGRFAFETRHPQARAWEGWNTSFELRNPDGEVARVEYEVEDVEEGRRPVHGDALRAMVGPVPDRARCAAVPPCGSTDHLSARSRVRRRRAVRRLATGPAHGSKQRDHHDCATQPEPSSPENAEHVHGPAKALDGAAQESNLPSRGLHDLTGFEEPLELATDV